MKLKITLCILLWGTVGFSEESSQGSAQSEKAWFSGARFGMFIHWGVYAVPAGVWEGKDIPGIGEWIMKNAKIPVVSYRALARHFTASRYDPESWAALARQAGMKYVVITSKHHDGFALYDSAATDWDVVSSGANRDLLLPLAKAVRREGLKFGLYYSQSQDWVHPGGRKSGILEGQPGWDPAQNGSFDEYLAKIALPQTREILGRFDPDVIWWDTPGAEMTPSRIVPFAKEMKKRPGLISNNRLGGGFEGDTMTPEQRIPPRGYPGKMFEVCMTMNDTWGFKAKDQNWKSTGQLLRNLSDIASKGGNFLLNVGPTAEGVIPQASVDRLQEIGRWMDQYGESIHGTQASPFPRRIPWGRVTRRAEGAGEILYLHVWDWPDDGRIRIPIPEADGIQAEILGKKGSPKIHQDQGGVVLEFPARPPDSALPVVKVVLARPLKPIPLTLPSPEKDGTIRLAVEDADCHGHYDGNIQTLGRGNETYLGNWKNPKYTIEYRVTNPIAAQWNVRMEVAVKQPVRLELAAGKEKTTVRLSPTAGAWQWQEVGVLQLPAGESFWEIRPVPEGWSEVRLRRVELTPHR